MPFFQCFLGNDDLRSIINEDCRVSIGAINRFRNYIFFVLADTFFFLGNNQTSFLVFTIFFSQCSFSKCHNCLPISQTNGLRNNFFFFEQLPTFNMLVYLFNVCLFHNHFRYCSNSNFGHILE